MATTTRDASVSDATLMAIVSSFADVWNDDSLMVLKALSRLNPRFESICAPRIAKYYEQCEARAQITPSGDRIYYDTRGKPHRDDDLPAITAKDGSLYWFDHGKRHRGNDRPAAISASGIQEWFLDGEKHRDGDKPAVVHSDGSQWWYQRGKLHREGDKPAGIAADGSLFWYYQGMFHRNNRAGVPMPAIIFADGTRKWYDHDVLLRTEPIVPCGLTK